MTSPVSSGPPLKKRSRWWLLSRLFIGVWIAVSLWLGSNAGLSIEALILAEVGGLLLLIAWFARLVSRLVRRRQFAGEVGASRGRRVVQWALEPATVVLCWLVVYYGLAFPIRFRLSRPALESYARSVQAGNVPSQTRIVGLFRVRETEALPGGVVRLITTSCMLDDCGVVFSPRGRPPRLGEDVYYPLSGGWWQWLRSW